MAEGSPGRKRWGGQGRRTDGRVAGESARAAAVAEVEEAVY